MMDDDKLKKVEDLVAKLQAKNLAILKKSSKIGVWLLVSGVICAILITTMLGVYEFAGFEKTLIIVLILMLFTQGKNLFI